MEVASGLLLTFVPFGANLVQLLVVPAIALEPADVIEAPLVVVARCQCLDPQIKGDNTISPQGTWLALFSSFVCLARIVLTLLRIIVDERAVIVPAHIPADSHFAEVVRRFLGEMGHNVGEAFGSPISPSSCRKRDSLPLHFQVLGRIWAFNILGWVLVNDIDKASDLMQKTYQSDFQTHVTPDTSWFKSILESVWTELQELSCVKEVHKVAGDLLARTIHAKDYVQDRLNYIRDMYEGGEPPL